MASARLALSLLVLACAAARTTASAPGSIPSSLPRHPRLIVTDADLARVRANTAADADASTPLLGDATLLLIDEPSVLFVPAGERPPPAVGHLAAKAELLPPSLDPAPAQGQRRQRRHVCNRAARPHPAAGCVRQGRLPPTPILDAPPKPDG